MSHRSRRHGTLSRCRTAPTPSFAQAVDTIGNTTDSGTVLLVVQNATPPAGKDLNNADIGNVVTPGGFAQDGSTYSVWGAGADIWGTVDAFRFAHTVVQGNFAIVASVQSVENVHPWTKGGLMVRERLTGEARHGFVFATPTAVNGVAFQRRLIEGGTSLHTSGPAVQAPVWLRLVREGDVITASYRFVESDPWTVIASETFAALSDQLYVGMAVTSHVDGTAAEARFQGFEVTPASFEPPSEPGEWQAIDVGTVAATGDVQFDGNSYTVRGSGADIWGRADAFHFAYIRATGDGAMTVRVADIAGPDAWSKAGLMIRASLSEDSIHHYLLASETNGLAYQRRLAAGDLSLHTAIGDAAPVWFRVERTGPHVRLSYSTESGTPSAWQPLVDTLFPEGEAFIGLAVTSHADGVMATGVFDHVLHTFRAAPDWTASDIGAVGIAGSDAFDGTTHTLAASGEDRPRQLGNGDDNLRRSRPQPVN